jgi:hypothetical protein
MASRGFRVPTLPTGSPSSASSLRSLAHLPQARRLECHDVPTDRLHRAESTITEQKRFPTRARAGPYICPLSLALA